MKGILLQTGSGAKLPTLNIGTEPIKGGQLPLSIDSKGKASIAYCNVNARRKPPLLAEDKARKIRDLLSQPKKDWHNIIASSTTELLEILRRIIKILQSHSNEQ